MKRHTELNARNREILSSIVQSYIETGEPVASRTISRLRGTLSAASVRNVMADLSDEGYLAQPHTSAGRVPTGKAFRVYVEGLQRRALQAQEVQRLHSRLLAAGSIESRMAVASQMLVEMTRRLGIAAAIPTSSQTLEQIELVALPDRRVLMIVATSDKMVHNRVVTLDAAFTQDELNAIRNYVNWSFQGWTLNRVRAELEVRLEKENAAYDAVLRRLNLLYNLGLLDVDADAPVHMEGASNLVDEQLLRTQERVRELLQALEQKKAVLQLLDRFLERAPGDVQVQVGLGEIHPSMESLSLIGVDVEMPGGMKTRVAVIGPMRMNYDKAISAVLHLGRAFQTEPK